MDRKHASSGSNNTDSKKRKENWKWQKCEKGETLTSISGDRDTVDWKSKWSSTDARIIEYEKAVPLQDTIIYKMPAPIYWDGVLYWSG